MKRILLALSIACLSAGPASADNTLMRIYARLGPRCGSALATTLNATKASIGATSLDTPTAVGGQVGTPYGTTITRVGGVTGGSFSAAASGTEPTVPWNRAATGTFGKDSRHHYTKDSPFNSDGTLFYLENPSNTEDSTGATVTNSATGPSKLILRVSDWSVTSYMQCYASDSVRDLRWHPTNPNWMVVLKQSSTTDTTYNHGDRVAILDVTTCQQVRTTNNDGANRIVKATLFGDGEGSVTRDGGKILLQTSHRAQNPTRPDTLQVVDLTTMTLGTPYAVPSCSLDVDGAGGMDCNIGHATLTPLGNYAAVVYASDDAYDGNATIDTTDAIRIFNVSGTTISGPRSYAIDTLCSMHCSTSPNRGFCGVSLIGGINKLTSSPGWIANLKHADFFVDPYTGQEAAFGIQRCGRTGSQGQVEMVDLNSGRMKRLTSAVGFTEGSVLHATCPKGTATSGWGFVSYEDNSSTFPQNEIVAVKTDGSGTVARLADCRTRDNAQYSAECHPSPGWDGKRIAFASNFVYNCATCGLRNEPKGYVISWDFCEP